MSTFAKENNILNQPTDGRNSYILVEDQNATDLLTMVLLANNLSKRFLRKCSKIGKTFINTLSSKTAISQSHSSNHNKLSFKIKGNNNLLDSIIKETYKRKLIFNAFKT